MSHYVILVTDVDKKPLDEQMAPFDENREVAAYVYKTKAERLQDALETRKRILWRTVRPR